MSHALYNNLAGLRFWRQSELRLRERIKLALVDCIQMTLVDMNQMWAFEEVEAPLMLPSSRISASYDSSDVFFLADAPGGTEPFAMRAETTDGTFAIAVDIMRSTNRKPPFCVYQIGPSFRRENTDGATAAKLRFNQFTQLEFQLIHSVDTKADIAAAVRDALLPVVRQTTGLETRLFASDRLPSYSTETVDIEVMQGNGEWREVASTSRRTDFPMIPSHKPCTVFEVAIGMDRLVALTQGHL